MHITQQCDLNGAVRVKKPGDSPEGSVSVMFAMTCAERVSDGRLPEHDTRDLVARGLRVGEEEYDLKLSNGRLRSLPLGQFIDFAQREKLQVVGRLRHDVAAHFLNATAIGSKVLSDELAEAFDIDKLRPAVFTSSPSRSLRTACHLIISGALPGRLPQLPILWMLDAVHRKVKYSKLLYT